MGPEIVNTGSPYRIVSQHECSILYLCQESDAALANTCATERKKCDPALNGLICHEILKVNAQEIAGTRRNGGCRVGRHLANVEDDGVGRLQKVVSSDVGDVRDRLLKLEESLRNCIQRLCIWPIVRSNTEAYRGPAVRQLRVGAGSADGTWTYEGGRFGPCVSEGEPDVAESRESPDGAETC